MKSYLPLILLFTFILCSAQESEIIHPDHISTKSKLISAPTKTSDPGFAVLDSLFIYKFHSETDSFAYQKEEFLYDNHGNKIQRIIWRTPLMVPPLEKDSKTAWEYFEDGKISSETWSYWNSEGSHWYYSWRYEYNYDSVENGAWRTDMWWDETENSWNVDKTFEFLLNSKGELIFNRVLGDEEYQNEVVFDEYGNHISTYSYFWDETLQKFVLLDIVIKTYNEYNNLICKTDTSIIHYGEGDQDTLYGKEEYEYNTDQKVISIIDYYPDSSGQWCPGFKDEFEYDEELCISYSLSIFDDDIGDWGIPSWLEYYVYNNEGLIIGQTDYSKNRDSDEHYMLNKHFYYYSASPVVNNEYLKENPDLSVYPNPSNGIFYVSINNTCKFQLLSLSGVIIEEGQLKGGMENKVDIGSQRKGIYILKIERKNSISTFKIIME